MKFSQTLLPVAAIGLCSLLTSITPAAPARAQKGQPVAVFVLRHAETEGSTRTGGDPLLSERGQGRAAAVARLLGHAGVTHVFASEFARTQATIAPLAEVTGLEIAVISARDVPAQIAALEELPPGSVAVVCGHSNTAPGIVAGLGGHAADLVEHAEYGGMLDHDSYDRMFALTLMAGEKPVVQTIELRYGVE